MNEKCWGIGRGNKRIYFILCANFYWAPAHCASGALTYVLASLTSKNLIPIVSQMKDFRSPNTKTVPILPPNSVSPRWFKVK